MPDPDIDALFERTLAGDYDDDEPWDAVRTLQAHGTREVFERAAEWCESSDALKRTRGADVLAQLGKTADHPDPVFADESFAILSKLVSNEQAPRPLSSAIAALGHIGNPAVVPLIVDLRAHPNDNVRFDVAYALGQLPQNEQSISALIEIMRDEDSDVRDWATLGLGSLGNTDSPEIRSALFLNMSDPDEDTRQEAMAGLAARGDIRVLEPLMKALEESPDIPCLEEAARDLLGLGWQESDRDGAELIAELRQKFAGVLHRQP